MFSLVCVRIWRVTVRCHVDVLFHDVTSKFGGYVDFKGVKCGHKHITQEKSNLQFELKFLYAINQDFPVRWLPPHHDSTLAKASLNDGVENKTSQSFWVVSHNEFVNFFVTLDHWTRTLTPIIVVWENKNIYLWEISNRRSRLMLFNQIKTKKNK